VSWGFPQALLGAYSTPSDSLAAFKGPTSKRRRSREGKIKGKRRSRGPGE